MRLCDEKQARIWKMLKFKGKTLWPEKVWKLKTLWKDLKDVEARAISGRRGQNWTSVLHITTTSASKVWLFLSLPNVILSYINPSIHHLCLQGLTLFYTSSNMEGIIILLYINTSIHHIRLQGWKSLNFLLIDHHAHIFCAISNSIIFTDMTTNSAEL